MNTYKNGALVPNNKWLFYPFNVYEPRNTCIIKIKLIYVMHVKLEM